MILEFVTNYRKNEQNLVDYFSKKHPNNYMEIVQQVILAVTDAEDYGWHNPDPDLVTEINHGDYQGTLLYVIAAKGYQPSSYWYVKVGYGSCSGCDTLKGITDYSSELPTKEQIQQYMLLALHILQGLKAMQ